MARKIKQANKCKKCGKILHERNKSGLCSHHYRMQLNNKIRKERKEEGLCVQCGKKVEPIILYEAGDTMSPIIKNPIRCYNCRKKQGEAHKRWLQKQKDKNVTE